MTILQDTSVALTGQRWKISGGSAGDVLQWARYLPRAAAQGVAVTLHCDPSLHRLLAPLRVPLRAPFDPDPLDWAYDVVCNPDVLPAKLEVTEIPPPPELWVDPAAPGWPLIGNLRVGLCWCSATSRPEGQWPIRSNRGVHPGALVERVHTPGVTLVSLQVGPQARATDGQGQPLILPAIPTGSDWATSAAYVRSCDLVITVDTGLAHLAGALGVPTWLMLPASGTTPQGESIHDPDGRWGVVGETTPWYSSLRLFRDAAQHGLSTELDKALAALVEAHA